MWPSTWRQNRVKTLERPWVWPITKGRMGLINLGVANLILATTVHVQKWRHISPAEQLTCVFTKYVVCGMGGGGGRGRGGYLMAE